MVVFPVGVDSVGALHVDSPHHPLLLLLLLRHVRSVLRSEGRGPDVLLVLEWGQSCPAAVQLQIGQRVEKQFTGGVNLKI